MKIAACRQVMLSLNRAHLKVVSHLEVEPSWFRNGGRQNCPILVGYQTDLSHGIGAGPLPVLSPGCVNLDSVLYAGAGSATTAGLLIECSSVVPLYVLQLASCSV